MFIESKNSIQSLQENTLDNRPMLQENFFFEGKEQKKTTQSKKGIEIFDKIFKEKEKEKEKFELDFSMSPIFPKNGTSLGLGSLQDANLQNFLTIMENKKNRYRTVHLEMDNFNDYMTNLKYLFDGKEKKYKYYFIYEYNQKYYIQFAPKNQKILDKNKMGKCKFLKNIDYEIFEELLDANLILDIKIAQSQIFLILSENGHPKYKKELLMNKKIIQYANKKNIDLYINDDEYEN